MTPAEELKRAIERAANSAFDTGLRVGRTKPATAQDVRGQVVSMAQGLIGGFVEQEVRRRVAEELAEAAQ